MHYTRGYSAIMHTPSDRLKLARERSGFSTAKEAAEAMGIPVPTYIQHENGIRGVPASRADRYANFFRVKPEWLLYGKTGDATLTQLGPQIFVVGEVQAGVFKTAWRQEPDDWEPFIGRNDLPVPTGERFGLRVAGDSMDLIYPPGTILECALYHQDKEIPSGKRVIVQRTRKDGDMEATVKELYRDGDGVEWLVPRSSNPSHRAFRGDQPESSEIIRTEILAIVVSSLRPE